MPQREQRTNRNVINEDFRSKTRRLVESAIGLLNSFVTKGEQIPLQISETYKVTGPGGRSMECEDKADYDKFIRQHEKEIQALPEFQLWAEAASTDPVVSKHIGHLVGTRHGMINRSPWEYVSHLILAHFSTGPELPVFDSETFEKNYRDMEALFYKDKVWLELFSPLQNFESDVEAIDLGGGLQIRKIAPAELEELLNESKWSPLIPFNEIIAFRYAMEFAFETEKYFLSIPLSALEPRFEDGLFGKLVTALRLFKAGAIGYNLVRETPLIDTPHLFGGTRGGLDYRHYWGPKYRLRSDELDEFKAFWTHLNSIELGRRAPIGIAVSRFNYAYERFGIEDKLIDYMIAFEALYFKTGERGEYRHKLAVRVARLLATDYENRKAIMREMAEFYDKRSEVVHGERTTFHSGFIEKVEEYLRKSIKHFVQLPPTLGHDVTISQLDLG